MFWGKLAIWANYITLESSLVYLILWLKRVQRMRISNFKFSFVHTSTFFARKFSLAKICWRVEYKQEKFKTDCSYYILVLWKTKSVVIASHVPQWLMFFMKVKFIFKKKCMIRKFLLAAGNSWNFFGKVRFFRLRTTKCNMNQKTGLQSVYFTSF